MGFKGCMKELKLGKKVLPFSGSNDVIVSVDVQNVQPDCKDSGRCAMNKCPLFSDCINTLSSYKCKCLPGHFGNSKFVVFKIYISLSKTQKVKPTFDSTHPFLAKKFHQTFESTVFYR